MDEQAENPQPQSAINAFGLTITQADSMRFAQEMSTIAEAERRAEEASVAVRLY